MNIISEQVLVKNLNALYATKKISLKYAINVTIVSWHPPLI